MIHILKSYHPDRMALLLNGQLLSDIWKRIPECLKRGESITVWAYCTKGKPHFENPYWKIHNIRVFPPIHDGINNFPFSCNGLVVCKFVVEKYDKIVPFDDGDFGGINVCGYEIEGATQEETNRISNESCLDYVEMQAYLGKKDGYALYITSLEIIEPMKLEEFYTVEGGCRLDCYPITKAPQSWCYCFLPPKENR